MNVLGMYELLQLTLWYIGVSLPILSIFGNGLSLSNMTKRTFFILTLFIGSIYQILYTN